MKLTRREMIDELLERVETELDELSNGQLSTILADYEHTPLLGGVVESVEDTDAEETDDEEEDEEELPLIDGDWDEEAEDEE